jgi:hypothetical protein
MHVTYTLRLATVSLAAVFLRHLLLILPNHEPTSQQYRRLVDLMMLVAQRPHPTSLHDKMTITQRLSNPPDRKRPKNMPMPHDQHIPIGRLILGFPNHRPMVRLPDLPDQPIDALNDVGRTLAPGTAIFPNIPGPEPVLGALLPDLRRRDALVVAVVPLADVGRDGDFGVGTHGRGLRVRDLPRVRVVAAEVEELERLLGARAGRDESVVARPEDRVVSR